MSEGGSPPGVNSAIASGAAFGNAGGSASTATPMPRLFFMVFGLNPSGTAQHDLGLKNMAVFGNSMIPHRNSLFSKRLFTLNSKSKGVSPSQLAHDAKLKQNGSGVVYNT